MATAATSPPSLSQLPAPHSHLQPHLQPHLHSQTLPLSAPTPVDALVAQLSTPPPEPQPQTQSQISITKPPASKPPLHSESITSFIPSPNTVKSIRTNYKHRQSSLSTSSTKGNRPSIFNFATLAREKTSSALASLSEPTLRTQPSSGSLYLSAQSSPSSTSPSRTSPRSPSSRETLRSVSPNSRTPTTSGSLASTQTVNSTNPSLSLSETNPPSQAYTNTSSETAQPRSTVPKPSHNKMHQTSSRLLRMTSDDRPFTRDFKDLFSTLVVSLPLAPHRVRLTRVDHSFISEEAINNLGSLKFSQSNRMPDPKDPSRIVTTTTTTTFSMAREMARSVCQRFLDARFVESADGKQAKEFTMKSSVWQLTPKGIHVLERFCARNGIQQKHVMELISSPRNTMRLVILERDLATDKLSSDRSTIEVIFRRFVGTNGPNVKSSTSSADSDSLSEYKDGIAGVRMASERKVGSPPRVVYQTFTGKAATDWLMDCCTTVDRRETTEMATLFLEQDLIWCVQADRVYLAQTGQEKEEKVRFQPTKHAIYQLSQKGKDVLSMNNRERTSESEGTTQITRPGGVNRDSNTQKLEKILNDAALRLLFRENLRDTHCEENLSFYLDVDEFLASCRLAIKANSPSRASSSRGTSGQSLDSVKETMASAYGIYNAFLAPGSPCELNIDHLLRNQLATRMTKAVGQDAAMIDSLIEVTDLFQEAQASVFKLMASDSVPKFMKSSKYEQTLKNYDFDSLAGRFKEGMHLPERSMSRSNR
ncbi:Regulator of G-protein signaling, RGS [Glarea lozoyensis ATCC 20868]|uniref:Regulator of G-protein signaling, RGS n=1 Tax=Glarea lozoyensis (strain ATCC 20868 / MF5171) TaxID=1116229 RepID=S3CJY5_GLAL2|nr:Regulator of G-protein signaling, RGS [Glarea lozoyensis ATCC 20868]EPE26105.1 Regulator of G-protein signaling, RGS [Glarea lozoyensis ATCC 20868]